MGPLQRVQNSDDNGSREDAGVERFQQEIASYANRVSGLKSQIATTEKRMINATAHRESGTAAPAEELSARTALD